MWQSLKEWSERVPQRWWDVISVPITIIPLVAGLIAALIVWTKKPLPVWGLAWIVGGAFLFIIVSFLAFHRMRVARDEFKSKLNTEQPLREKLEKEKSQGKDSLSPALQVGGRVKTLELVTANHVVLGGGIKEGNVIALVEAVFNPKNPPLKITRVALEVWGKQLETAFPPNLVNKGDDWSGFFEIPEGLVKDNAKARLVVDVGNSRYFSSEFSIPFEKKDIWHKEELAS